MERCPHCHANLDGGPIPEDIRENYSPPYRWSRAIACVVNDRVHHWMCPVCNGVWTPGAALSTPEAQP
jgi:Zn-finger nucleic acid-binding protein